MNYYQGVPTSKISPTERQLNLVIALLNTSTYPVSYTHLTLPTICSV